MNVPMVSTKPSPNRTQLQMTMVRAVSGSVLDLPMARPARIAPGMPRTLQQETSAKRLSTRETIALALGPLLRGGGGG